MADVYPCAADLASLEMRQQQVSQMRQRQVKSSLLMTEAASHLNRQGLRTPERMSMVKGK